jgi:uncharacterized protein YjbI with pentapeptide repeats
VTNQELLALYQQGERNFRKQDLSGQSFVGHDLTEVDMSGADLRGVNFTNASLRGANFTGIRAGLQRSEEVMLMLSLGLTTVALAASAGFVGTLLNLQVRAFTNSFEEVTAGWAILLILGAFALVSVLEGVAAGFSVFAVAFGLAIAVAIVGPLISTLVHPVAFAIAAATGLAITIASAVTALTVFASIVAMATFRAFDLRTALAIPLIYVAVFICVVSITEIVTSMVAVVPAVMLLSGYLGWQALQGHPKHRLMRRLARVLVIRWGTSFRGADLSHANFSHSNLKNVNFDEANLTRVCWTGAETTQTALSAPAS